MSYSMRFTRPCRAELIRLLGALAEQDLQLAQQAHQQLEHSLTALQQDITHSHKLDQQYPFMHEARLALGALEVGLVFAVEADGMLTMLAVRY